MYIENRNTDKWQHGIIIYITISKTNKQTNKQNKETYKQTKYAGE
jgi:hypothetical protein